MNRYAQVFATRFGWVCAYPMKKKSDAHHRLSLMAQRDGVPPVLVMDGSKKQTLGEFRRKARQMGCHVKQSKPYSPWQIAAEGEIRELKRGAGRKMARSKCPKKLWDHCLELEAYIRSNTALSMYELQGEVPEMIMSGQTADILPFAELPWYSWVKFFDPSSGYPENKQVLGRWLGPIPDVGPAMTSKILKDNGFWIYTSSYRALNEDELQDPKEKTLRDEYDAKIRKKLGQELTEETMKELDIDVPTPKFPVYKDEVEGTQQQVPDIDDVTPEEQDNYVGAEVNLPIGGTMKSGRDKQRARDSEGELVGTASNNPIRLAYKDLRS